jgi:hypothetical protein
MSHIEFKVLGIEDHYEDRRSIQSTDTTFGLEVTFWDVLPGLVRTQRHEKLSTCALRDGLDFIMAGCAYARNRLRKLY